eukprot:TRINITY_DN42891_c0_g1_i1.p1 TRINITY_DN42891_c0_g1~~TRINITY_DN42891_c0_g1_i1.p1  ORF type:complete len:301 (+),score=77.81 TRINITY_DN42891_c0_g1_i1:101-1003(+)
MELAIDPFDDAKEEIDLLFKEATALRTRLRNATSAAATSPLLKHDEADARHIFEELTKTCRALQENVAALQQTVAVVEQQRSVFRISDAELARRRQAVSQAQRQFADFVASVPKATTLADPSGNWLLPPTAAASVPTVPPAARPKPEKPIDPIASIRANLDAGGKPPVPAKPQPATAGSVKSAHFDDFDRNNDPLDADDFMHSEFRRHQEMIEEQDKHLDDLQNGVLRIKHAARQIGDEVDRQRELLTQLDSSVDTLKGRLATAQKKLDQTLNQMNSKNKACLVAVMVAILVLLIILLLL